MVYVETVTVENSDDRLAEVEKAKRTGNAFVSVGTRGSEIVPLEIATAIAEEKSKQDTAVYNGRTVAAHRLEYIEERDNDADFVPRTNEEKAEAHHAHSAELVRQRNEQDEKDRKRAKEGFDFAQARQEENQRLADEYREAMIAWQKQRLAREEGAPTVVQLVDTIVENVDVAALAEEPLEVRANAYGNFVNTPDALEKPAEEALTIKDAIIATKENYRDHAEGGVVTDLPQREAQVEEAESEDVVSPEPEPKTRKSSRSK